MKTTLYKNEQYGYLLNGILSGIIVFLVLALLKSTDTASTIILSVVIVLIFITWLLTYKLTIIVDDKAISAIFGIGLLKRKVALNDIDFSTLQVITPSKFAGIGIRLTNKGWLWNVKFGKALYFKTKTGKTFFVGADDAEKLKEMLLNVSST